MDRLDALKNKGKSDSLLDFANRLSFKEKKVIQDLFKQIDVDGDGAISKSELGEVSDRFLFNFFIP
jgi:Ca2+-binding EF-hand superfamily protein